MSGKNHKIVIVTAAGRRHYMELLKHYVLNDDFVDEWRLWDNCRTQADRDYINDLASKYQKITVVTAPVVDGSIRSINQFYRYCDEPDTFYLKVDDDVVFMAPDMVKTLYLKAEATRDQYIWWSPLVVNNAICTYALYACSVLKTDFALSAQASSHVSWKDPRFAEMLHRGFLDMAKRDCLPKISDFPISLSRFSINAIGFFGSELARIGDQFCPADVDDEEWISATLPVKVGRPGLLVGASLVSHFSFFPQESSLLKSGILDDYYALAGLSRTYAIPAPKRRGPLDEVKKMVRSFIDVRSKGSFVGFTQPVDS